jgi:hypothetical protein
VNVLFCMNTTVNWQLYNVHYSERWVEWELMEVNVHALITQPPFHHCYMPTMSSTSPPPRKTYPCKKESCSLQACLSSKTGIVSSDCICSSQLEALTNCCRRFYDLPNEHPDRQFARSESCGYLFRKWDLKE